MSSLLSLRWLAVAAASISSIRPAFASTWNVAPSPGPGVDFTNIQTAINTVPAGDQLTVQTGSWGDFALTKGLTILGASASVSFGQITVQGVSGGPRVELAKLRCSRLQVLDCARVVLLDDVTVANSEFGPGWIAQVANCADVRLLRCTLYSGIVTDGLEPVYPTLSVVNSRVELVRCSLTGRSGALGDEAHLDYPAGHGSDALHLGASANVHVALTQILGGNGGDYRSCSDGCEEFPGNGGHAIHVVGPNAKLIVAGQSTDVCRGGNAGANRFPPLFLPESQGGSPGRGLYLSGGSSARVSGETFVGGGVGSNPPTGVLPIVSFGALTLPVPADPSLELLSGPQTPGSLVTFAVHAEPGSSVRLRFGRRPIVEDLPFSAEDRLVENLRAFNLGIVPPSGTVLSEAVINEDLPVGALIVFQAACTETSSVTEMSQSLPLIVR